MTQVKPLLSVIPSVVQRYGLAVVSVAIALGVGLLLANFYVEGVQFPIFLIAIAITVWFAGTLPAILALVLATLAFNYYFTAPRYSFHITLDDIPYYAVFILFALLITWFSTARRRIERDLRQSRDELQEEVARRTQQASLLNLTHDTIFVRDMKEVITYWNRGAQELYVRRTELRIIVRDNGCGIHPVELRRNRHWGLQGMCKRAEGIGARLRFWGRVAGGTEVELCVPGRVAFEQLERMNWRSLRLV